MNASSTAKKAGGVIRTILDATVGNVGFGLGFGSAYAAEIPIFGVPFASLNEGVKRGYGAAEVRIIASRIIAGKSTVEEEMGKLDPERKAALSTHVERKKGNLAQNENLDPKTGEVLGERGGLSFLTGDDRPERGAVGGAG